MSDPPAARQILVAAGDVTTDLPCARCGYNLRGLSGDHLCPECGTPIERSLMGNLLRFADPEWLEKLHLGVALKLWMLLFAVLFGIAGSVATKTGFFVVQAALSLLAGALGLLALWLITVPEPNIATSEDPMSLRRLLRACAVIGFLGGQTQVFTGATPAMAPGAMPGSVLLVAIGVMMLIGLVAMFGEFVYLRRFARRLPDQKLADNTTVVMWGYCFAMAVAAIMGAIAAIVVIPLARAATAGATTPPNPPTWALGVLGFLGCGVAVGMLVFGLWYIVLLFQYHGALRNALVEARQLLQQDHASSPH